MSNPTNQPDRNRGNETRHRPRFRLLVASAVAFALVGTAAATAVNVGATPPSPDPTTAAQFGARWAATQVNPSGFVPGPTSTPNLSATIETAITLASAGVEQPTFNAIVTWLQANAASAIDPDGTGDNPGNLGNLLMIAHAAGVDPTAFGGQNLITRLGATLGGFAPGLYGAADPTYDGVYRQSLALLGLEAAGVTLPATAVAWLEGQQCDATVAAAHGGFEAFRADTAVACVAPDPNTFVGPDTNSTAIAVQALAVVSGFGGGAAALDFLNAAESATAGFAYITGGTDDPNSTSLVILGIIAGGESPTTGRWTKGAADPYTSLLGWQLGCDQAAADRGAFASPFSSGAADAFATRQAVWGAAGKPFPLTGPASFQVAPVPCAPPTTTTTAPTTTTTVTTVTTVPVVDAQATAAVPVVAAVAFTG